LGDYNLTNERNKLHSFINEWQPKVFVCQDVGDAKFGSSRQAFDGGWVFIKMIYSLGKIFWTNQIIS
jgi:hypothetical protein